MKPKAPYHLSDEAKEIWDDLQDQYWIDDKAGQFLLQTCLEAFDRMRAAQKQIKHEGQTVLDRFDQVKVHPMCSVERDARNQVIAALKALELDISAMRKANNNI
jgi:P27 family predicted phage terminase small subunit